MIPKDSTLEEFDLIWRFSNAEKYTQLSPAEFKRFRPIPLSDSLKLWEQYVFPGSELRERHITSLYVNKLIKWPECTTYGTTTEEDEEQLLPILKQEIQVPLSSELLFFWHAEISVRTDWGLFLDHWDDFSYPSDDSNVMVLPSHDKAIINIEHTWHIVPRKIREPIFLKLKQ